MTLNKKLVNIKHVDPVSYKNFGINYVNIWDHLGIQNFKF